ncbi:MAG: hypothetical protein I3273_01580 [Candidatus Moeniiplasma glomeromycotorum]|nr:hypothetical protein [Candidatus Moeniiplasma glomeromycotorum]MCE8167187.1 hypothetical protein [Candidatus Moeniiplasma glomeromycotorum]MCE8168801.1 hypothetical protein [Candidatus Moeniiplasma glomeromycotorum]
MSKKIVNEEQCQQILKMVDSVALDRKQISEKLAKIIDEPRDWKESLKNCWMTEAIYRGMSKLGSMAYSELEQREKMLDKIQQKVPRCCYLELKLSETLKNRKKGEIHETIIISEYTKRTLTKLSLIDVLNGKLFLSHWELKEALIKFVSRFFKVREISAEINPSDNSF